MSNPANRNEAGEGPPLVLSRQQAKLVDQLAVQQYGLSGLVLMETAGCGCCDRLLELGAAGPVVICCGKGNNGGDGFVMARHLESRGAAAKVLVFCNPDELQGDAAVNYRILSHTEVPIVVFGTTWDPARLKAELEGAEWIVDALLGTGARGMPRPPLDRVIEQVNSYACRKLAVDVPSGLDCDTGQPAAVTFRADHTCTFVAPKPGLLAPSAAPYVGQLHVIDLGLPRRLIRQALGSTSH